MLLEFIEERQKEQFAQLFVDYERKMYQVAYAILERANWSEDCVYQSFLKIIHHFEKIISFPCQEQEAYIVVIVKNSAIDILRKERRLAHLPEEWDIPDPGATPEADARYHYLVELIRSMPDTYRQVLEMSLVLEMSIPEIAKRLDLRDNTVSARLCRGRKLLQEKLKELGY